MSHRLAMLFVSLVLATASITTSTWAANPIDSALWALHRLTGKNPIAHSSAIDHLFDDIQRTLSPAGRVDAEGFETTKYQDYYQGIEVVGSVVSVHTQRSSSFLLGWSESPEVDDSMVIAFDLSTRPTLSAREAAALALAQFPGLHLKSRPALKILPDFESRNARLVYWVELDSNHFLDGRFDVVVDAHRGTIVAEIPFQLTIAPVHIFHLGPEDQVTASTGQPVYVNWSGADHVVKNGEILPDADGSARRAAANSQATLKYYSERFGRNSFDGRGSQLTSYVHVGKKWGNAFWKPDMNIMAYGDGDGEVLGDMTASVDVAGHEMTHGVISKTADLKYMGESGALNEALADFFGKRIEGKDNWILGRGLFVKDPNRGVRHLADPSVYIVPYFGEDGEVLEKPYPAHMKNAFVAKGTCGRANDHCWVHVNSTIMGHATYRISKAIGAEKTEKMIYATLVHRLKPLSGFRHARNQILKVCSQMYTEGECSQVKAAFQAVGL